jgi:anti-sigma factor RsiW
MMDEASVRDLLRQLRGELPAAEAAALDRRLEMDAELRAERDRLASAWAALDGAPTGAVPPGFSERVMARARAERGGDWSWAALPGWARLAAAAALVVGIAAGAGAVAVAAPGRSSEAGQWNLEDEALAESYLTALENDAEPAPETP